MDGRTDIYSLGCVAYYMLTGQPVFDEATAIATAVAHVSNVPIPPRRRSPFTIPPSLDALIMECLAKDPDDRPESATTVSERLASGPGGYMDGRRCPSLVAAPPAGHTVSGDDRASDCRRPPSPMAIAPAAARVKRGAFTSLTAG